MNNTHDVVLINMPFSNLRAPSIGLGLLKGALNRVGITSKTFHFQFNFAKLIGEDAYSRINTETHPQHLVGEWIFSRSLFQHRLDGDADQYANEIFHPDTVDAFDDCTYTESLVRDLVAVIRNAGDKVEIFLEECLASVVNCRPRVVGFTSVFQQHVSSLALARLIRVQLPDTFIVFGGPNCEGMMGNETLRQFGFVDAVVSGEGDFVFPEMTRRILDSQPISNMAGVFCRDRSKLGVMQESLRNAPIVEDLNALPIPDYDEYFEQFSNSSLDLSRKPGLLFETSRGCWWGEKHHCTFCGLNGATMAYRSKSARRAFDELVYLTDRHPNCDINVVDNILDMNYFKDFIPMLAERKREVGLFYEVKANLRKEQLRLMIQAGIRAIQPGIESLSDNVLRIMRKGVSSLQNLQLIKWCRELGIDVSYNLIWGFPGESAEDYLEMVKLIPLITHLPPPVGAGRVRIDRFSPNFNESEQLGFKSISPHPAYRHVYPFEPKALFNLAYFFIPEYIVSPNFNEYVEALTDEIVRWKKCYSKSNLFWMEKEADLLIWDFRPGAKDVLTLLKGRQKFVYMACDQITSAQQVVALWRKQSEAPLDEADVRNILDDLVARALLVKQENLYLALAYPRVLGNEGGEQP